MASQKVRQGQVSDPSWIVPTMINSWVDYDAVHVGVGYMKDALGFVHLKGLIRSGTIGATIFTLPAGYKNTKHMHFPAMANGTFAVIRIDISGAVTSSGYASNAYLTLDGITFKADA